MMSPSLNKIVIYAKDVPKMVSFYEEHFGFVAYQEEGDRIIELISVNGGIRLMIHQAGKAMKDGQALIKLVFDVADVETFHARCAKNGLKFGTIHQADGYVYANGKDPGKNSIQISSRAFRKSSKKKSE